MYMSKQSFSFLYIQMYGANNSITINCKRLRRPNTSHTANYIILKKNFPPVEHLVIITLISNCRCLRLQAI